MESRITIQGLQFLEEYLNAVRNPLPGAVISREDTII